MKQKFRIWSKKYKLFTDDVKYPNNQSYSERYLIDQDGEIVIHMFSPFNLHEYLTEVDGEYIVQWWSGKKDKDGKLIYEGDIIQDKLGDEFVNFVCKYDEVWEKFLFRMFNDDDSFYLHPEELNKKDCRVIGNIFENPELLKQ